MNDSGLKKVPLWLWVIFGFFLLNVLTYDWYTTVWMDEVMYTDPAANHYFGKGFTSTAWAFQNKDAFWAGNVPLYSSLLVIWFKICGFGIFQTRLLDYLLWALASTMICLSARRFRWVTSGKSLALLAVLTSLGPGTAFICRSGRYDPLAVLLAAACLWASSLSGSKLRLSAIFLVSCLFFPAYPAFAPFCALMAVGLLLVNRGKIWCELMASALGGAMGIGLLYVLYHHFGVWTDFLHAVTGNTQTYYNRDYYHTTHIDLSVLLHKKMADGFSVLFADKSSLLLLLGILALLFFRKVDAPLKNHKLVAFSLLAFVIIPFGMLLVYAFPIYYWWMRYLPLCLSLVTLLETVTLPGGNWSKALLVAVVGLVVSVNGLPGRLLFAADDLSERNYHNVENVINGSIKTNDVVFADYQAFYPLQKLKVRTYYGWYLNVITKPEEDSITCLVINPDALPGTEKALGGQWQPVGAAYLHENKFHSRLLNRLLPGYFQGQTNQKYNLAVYRRAVVAETPP